MALKSQPGRIARVLVENPYVAEDVDGDIVLETMAVAKTGMLVNMQRTEVLTAMLNFPELDRIHREYYATNRIYHKRVPELNAYWLTGEYVESVKRDYLAALGPLPQNAVVADKDTLTANLPPQLRDKVDVLNKFTALVMLMDDQLVRDGRAHDVHIAFLRK